MPETCHCNKCREQGARSMEHGAGNREQRTENREQIAENKAQGTGLGTG